MRVITTTFVRLSLYFTGFVVETETICNEFRGGAVIGILQIRKRMVHLCMIGVAFGNFFRFTAYKQSLSTAISLNINGHSLNIIIRPRLVF